MCRLAELCKGMYVRGAAVLCAAQWPPPGTLGIRGGAGPPCARVRAVLSRLSHLREDVNIRQHECVPLSSYHPHPESTQKSTQPRAPGSVRVCFRHR